MLTGGMSAGTGGAYTGVILSAGRGSRIDPLHAHYPKPLLPIGNRPILVHQIDILRSLGIRDVRIVVGHLMERIVNALLDGREHGVSIGYVEQEQTLGIAHAVGRLDGRIDGPFVLSLGDIFFLPERIERLVERYERGDVAAVLAVTEEPDPARLSKNFSVELGEGDLVARVVEKPRRPRSTLKGCGIYLFGPEVFDAIRKTPRTALRDEYEITTTLQILIDDGARIAAAPVIAWDLNITYARDLLEGNRRWLAHRGLPSLVAPEAHVHPGARIEGSVIGPGAVIADPILVRDSVILPGAVVKGTEDVISAVVASEVSIRC